MGVPLYVGESSASTGEDRGSTWGGSGSFFGETSGSTCEDRTSTWEVVVLRMDDGGSTRVCVCVCGGSTCEDRGSTWGGKWL